MGSPLRSRERADNSSSPQSCSRLRSFVVLQRRLDPFPFFSSLVWVNVNSHLVQNEILTLIPELFLFLKNSSILQKKTRIRSSCPTMKKSTRKSTWSIIVLSRENKTNLWRNEKFLYWNVYFLWVLPIVGHESGRIRADEPARNLFLKIAGALLHYILRLAWRVVIVGAPVSHVYFEADSAHFKRELCQQNLFIIFFFLFLTSRSFPSIERSPDQWGGGGSVSCDLQFIHYKFDLK